MHTLQRRNVPGGVRVDCECGKQFGYFKLEDVIRFSADISEAHRSHVQTLLRCDCPVLDIHLLQPLNSTQTFEALVIESVNASLRPRAC